MQLRLQRTVSQGLQPEYPTRRPKLSCFPALHLYPSPKHTVTSHLPSYDGAKASLSLGRARLEILSPLNPYLLFRSFRLFSGHRLCKLGISCTWVAEHPHIFPNEAGSGLALQSIISGLMCSSSHVLQYFLFMAILSVVPSYKQPSLIFRFLGKRSHLLG